MATCGELTLNSCDQNNENDSVDTVVANNSDNMNNAGELDSDKFELSEADVICNNTPETVNGDDMLAEVRTNVRSQLEELKERIGGMTEIPDLLTDISLKCLEMSTLQYLSYHLDPESDIMTEDKLLKDYRGLAEWIGLENIFIRYISKANYAIEKTSEVVSKWLTRTEEPLPTLGNLQRCLKKLERIDVLEDMSVKMAKDAVEWKLTELEANAGNANRRSGDTSWQLTRHDVISGKETFYTCCLLFSDEDYSIARMIVKLFTSVYRGALFFMPQFDLKVGTFAAKATVDVIEERCGGRVIFIISEYLFASSLNQFVVEYSRTMDIESQDGSLVPFFLTNKTQHVPRLLRGLVGVRWYQRTLRKRQLLLLADNLLGGLIPQSDLESIKINIEALLEKFPEEYIDDPKYDDDVSQPGQPLPVYDPEPEVENSDDPSSRLFQPTENECLMSESSSPTEQRGIYVNRPILMRIRHYLRKKISNILLNREHRVVRSSPPRPTESSNIAYRD